MQSITNPVVRREITYSWLDVELYSCLTIMEMLLPNNMASVVVFITVEAKEWCVFVAADVV